LSGTNEHFSRGQTNTRRIDIGRNFTAEDVDLGRPIIVIGQSILKKLFPAESPLGKMIKLGGRRIAIVGTFAEKGTNFGQSQDDIAMVPITRFLSDYGAARFTINLATQAPSQARIATRPSTRVITAMRIVRSLKADDENDFDIYSNDSLIAAFAKVADAVRARRARHYGIALLARAWASWQYHGSSA